MTEFLNAFLGWIGGIAIMLSLVGMVDNRIGGLFACAWIAWVDAKKAFTKEFRASYNERYALEFPKQQQSSLLQMGSE